MKTKDFAVLILSHGRADRVVTVPTLRKCGYTGDIYIVIDDQDSDEEEYYKRYGDKVIKFCKADEAERSDVMDQDTDMRIVLYARNRCHDIAKELGLTYFLELDDDYNAFRFRRDEDGVFTSTPMSHLDDLFDAMIDFLEVSGAVTVALAQSGDFIGGTGSSVWQKQLARKAMNSFFCKTDRPFKFLGRINEDVNAYTLLSSQGKLFFTVARATLNQEATQQNAKGLTDVYLKYGTYVKSFYTVMCMPSAAKVQILNTNHKRIHHKILWDRCTPQIISDRYRKHG